jgi:hypothetical protein
MNRSTVSALLGVSLLGGLAGCELWEPAADVDVQPALSMNGKSLVGDADRQYDAGKRALAEGRFGVAAQAFQAALLAGGPSVERLNALAVAYDHLGRYDLSDQYYRRALALDARNAQTLNNFAVSLARRGLPDKAALVFAEAKRDAPENETVTANLAQLEADGHRAAASPAPKIVAAAPPPQAPALPRVEHVAVGTMQLITAESRDGNRPGAVSQGPAPEIPFSSPHVAKEVAAAPSAVQPVAVAAATVVPAPETKIAVAEVARDRAAAPAPQPRVEVANGAGRNRMATRMRAFLKPRGVRVVRLTNDKSFHHRTTVIAYRPGFEQAARDLARDLPVPVTLTASTTLRGDIRLCLGHDLMEFDLALQTTGKKHEA